MFRESIRPEVLAWFASSNSFVVLSLAIHSIVFAGTIGGLAIINNHLVDDYRTFSVCLLALIACCGLAWFQSRYQLWAIFTTAIIASLAIATIGLAAAKLAFDLVSRDGPAMPIPQNAGEWITATHVLAIVLACVVAAVLVCLAPIRVAWLAWKLRGTGIDLGSLMRTPRRESMSRRDEIWP